MPDPSSWDADAAVGGASTPRTTAAWCGSVPLVRDLETAEEVVQDSFVATHGRWRRLRDPDKGLAYLRQTVVNRSRSVLRHRAVEARHSPAPLPDGPGADEDALATERRTRVLDALRELPSASAR